MNNLDKTKKCSRCNQLWIISKYDIKKNGSCCKTCSICRRKMNIDKLIVKNSNIQKNKKVMQNNSIITDTKEVIKDNSEPKKQTVFIIENKPFSTFKPGTGIFYNYIKQFSYNNYKLLYKNEMFNLDYYLIPIKDYEFNNDENDDNDIYDIINNNYLNNSNHIDDINKFY